MRVDHEIVVIGAGPGGIGAGALLKRSGITDFAIVERAGDVGGSWRDNTYPGIGVDIPSVAYQYSFAKKADWSHLFARGGEVKAYHENVARAHDLYPHFIFHADIVREVWDEAGGHWKLHTADGRTLTARFVISAVGAFLRPKIGVGLDGVEEFGGKILRPSEWDHSYDLSGKRVAVIGTGASSVQITPSIAPEVAHLDVYQRTPAWCLRKKDIELSPRFQRALRIPGFAALLHGIMLSGVEVATRFLSSAPLALAKPIVAVVDARSIRAYRNYVHSVVDDPETAEKLVPSYGPMGKRPTASRTYLPTFNRDNVGLITEGIDRITPAGIRTVDGVERPYDVVVLATGYEMFSDPESYRPGAVVGRDGFDLSHLFATEGLQAYESVAIPGLPNRWMLAGPYSWTGTGWHTLVEAAAHHVIRVLREARVRGAGVVEVRRSAHVAYHAQVRRRGRVIKHYYNVQNRGLRTYYVNSQGDMPYIRPSSFLEALWHSRHFPIDDYSFETQEAQAVMTREFGVPTDYSVPADISMADNVFAYGEEEPGRVVFQVATGRAVWRDVTAAEFAATVSAVGKGLIASGVEAGDRVAIMASTRYEWTVLEYAVWAVGGCTVAIYDSSSAEQTKWILEDSGTSLLVVETPAHRALVAEIEDGLPGLVETLQLESGAVDELRARGAGVSDDMLRDRRALVDSAAPATLIYTSGTTGKPKGVPLSHANLKAESVILYSVFEGVFFEGNRTLVFLPMAHIFAQLVTSVAFDGKVVVAHTADWSTLVEQFAAFRPDFLTAVPRVFEKVYDSARQRAHDGGKGRIFDAAAATAIAYSKALDNGRPGIALKARHALFDRLVYARLRSAIGGRCGTAVSAGGPLGERLGHFFRGAGIPVYEGWGLTETTAAITVNNAAHQRIGSVGRPIPGHTVRVADDGELLVRGPVVFEGYRNNATANEEGFTDGWFRTGDLGTIDEQGYVTITGRKKEIIVTAGGKNVSPMVLEDSLRANPLISQCMVVGDGKPFIGALITLDAETLTGWKERNGLSADLSADHLIDNSALYAEIESAVTEANTKVSRAESIRKFRILPTDWTTEAGELTPKMSLKRSVILKQYAAEVDKIYNSEVG